MKTKAKKPVRRSAEPATCRSPVEFSALETLVRRSELRATVQSGYLRVEGTTGRRIYVPLKGLVARVDLSGDWTMGVPHRLGTFGRVSRELCFRQPPRRVLADFARALAAL